MVNGTRESDWPAVAALAAEVPWVLPSLACIRGMSASVPRSGSMTSRSFLDAHPDAGVGEIGLDRWIEGHDLDEQSEVFRAQLALAAERDRAVTIHCIRAWGALWEILRTHPLPARGFLIHAYGGPWEMTRGFLDRGGYFSFNAYFLHERKAAQRESSGDLPPIASSSKPTRPISRPPAERNPHPLTRRRGPPINHPANLALAYRVARGIARRPARRTHRAGAGKFRAALRDDGRTGVGAPSPRALRGEGALSLDARQ